MITIPALEPSIDEGTANTDEPVPVLAFDGIRKTFPAAGITGG